jgi:nucleotide-binding universal stress UspA family protein
MNWLIELPEIILAQDAGLIVMGTQGAGGVKKLLLGTNTTRVIADAKCHVLVVPPQAGYTGFRNIALAYDKLYIEDMDTFTFLRNLTAASGSRLEIFHVNTEAKPEHALPEHVAELHSFMSSVQHTYTELQGDSFDEEIDDHLAARKTDMLAMMHRNRSLFERLFRPSLSIQRAYHTEIPLLVIPEQRS